MKTKLTILLATAAAGSLLMIAAPNAHAQTELVFNGSFEMPLLDISPILNIPGWVVPPPGGSGIFIGNASNWPAFDGVNSLMVMGRGTISKIYQTLATTPGTAYQLSFEYSDALFSGTNTQSIAVNVFDMVPTGNTPNTLFTSNFFHSGGHPTSLATMNYTLGTGSFVATTTTTTLQFGGSSGSNLGMVIDNVSVKALSQGTADAPEPAAVALLVSALPIGFWRARRRQTR